MEYEIATFLNIVKQMIPSLSLSQRQRFTEKIQRVIYREKEMKKVDDQMTFDECQQGIQDALDILFEGLPLGDTYNSIRDSVQREYNNNTDLPTSLRLCFHY